MKEVLYVWVMMMAFLSAFSLPWQFLTWADTDKKRDKATMVGLVGLAVFALMLHHLVNSI